MSYNASKEWNDDMAAGEAAMRAAEKERREGTFLTAEQIGKLTELLDGIENPLIKLEKDAAARGMVLNSMAIMVANDVSILREWAREARGLLRTVVSKQHPST
jgi:hypothetical protein